MELVSQLQSPVSLAGKGQGMEMLEIFAYRALNRPELNL